MVKVRETTFSIPDQNCSSLNEPQIHRQIADSSNMDPLQPPHLHSSAASSSKAPLSRSTSRLSDIGRNTATPMQASEPRSRGHLALSVFNYTNHHPYNNKEIHRCLSSSNSFYKSDDMTLRQPLSQWCRSGSHRRGLTRVKTSAFNLDGRLPDPSISCPNDFEKSIIGNTHNKTFNLSQSTGSLRIDLPGTQMNLFIDPTKTSNSMNDAIALRNQNVSINSRHCCSSLRSIPSALEKQSRPLSFPFQPYPSFHPPEERSFATLQHHHNQIQSNWQSLNFSEKLSLFNWWSLISLTANILHLSATILCFVSLCDVNNRLFVLGLACFITWINLLHYLKYSPSLYFHTIKRGENETLIH